MEFSVRTYMAKTRKPLDTTVQPIRPQWKNKSAWIEIRTDPNNPTPDAYIHLKGLDGRVAYFIHDTNDILERH